MLDGSVFVSQTAITGIFSLLASATAIDSLLVSIINNASGVLVIFLIPPKVNSSLFLLLSILSLSFFVRL